MTITARAPNVVERNGDFALHPISYQKAQRVVHPLDEHYLRSRNCCSTRLRNAAPPTRQARLLGPIIAQQRGIPCWAQFFLMGLVEYRIVKNIDFFFATFGFFSEQ
jgi:hypothetical protein